MSLIKLLCILLLNWLQLSSSLLNPIDFLALQAIRSSLDDVPGSNFFKSWDFTSDPCDFPGVFCDTTSNKVISLNLGDPSAGSPGLSGRINPAIGKLSSLAEFTIVPGRIMGQIPASVSELSNLKFFAISRNYLSGEIPPGIGELRGLETLDLSYNQFSGKIPITLSSLPALCNFIVSHNHLIGEIPNFTSSSLTRVDLMHNNLSGSVSPTTFPATVEYLSLSSNKLAGPVDLAGLTDLKYLDLSMNGFSGAIPSEIFRLQMTNLHLQRNFFSGTVTPEDEVTIQTVDLSYNRLSGEISPFFSTVQNLYLNNNRFSGKVPLGLVNRVLDASIHVLYLQHNYLTGIQINPTAEIPVSSSLCLQYNCMVPPLRSTCPIKAGTQKTRPTSQCVEWKG